MVCDDNKNKRLVCRSSMICTGPARPATRPCHNKRAQGEKHGLEEKLIWRMLHNGWHWPLIWLGWAVTFVLDGLGSWRGRPGVAVKCYGLS